MAQLPHQHLQKVYDVATDAENRLYIICDLIEDPIVETNDEDQILSILRQAMGTQQTPPNQVLIAIALFLTFFIMTHRPGIYGLA